MRSSVFRINSGTCVFPEGIKASFDDVVKELSKQTESGQVRWRQPGLGAVIAEVGRCSFLINKLSNLDGYMALHVRTGNDAPSERVGASPSVDQLFYSVRDKLGLSEHKPDQNTLQTALQCLQDNNFKSTAGPREHRPVR